MQDLESDPVPGPGATRDARSGTRDPLVREHLPRGPPPREVAVTARVVRVRVADHDRCRCSFVRATRDRTRRCRRRERTRCRRRAPDPGSRPLPQDRDRRRGRRPAPPPGREPPASTTAGARTTARPPSGPAGRAARAGSRRPPSRAPWSRATAPRGGRTAVRARPGARAIPRAPRARRYPLSPAAPPPCPRAVPGATGRGSRREGPEARRRPRRGSQLRSRSAPRPAARRTSAG